MSDPRHDGDPVARRGQVTSYLVLNADYWKDDNLIRSKVVIAIPCPEIVIEPPLSFTFDGLTEKLTTLTCDTEEEVEAAIKRSIYFVSMRVEKLCVIVNFQFMNNQNGGLLCFFYSIILSKGFEK